MNTNDIVQKAKERLAEIEAEAARLRAMIAAAEGRPTKAPIAQPPSVLIPYPIPQPMPWAFDRVTCMQFDDSQAMFFVDGAAYRTEYTVTPFSLSAEAVRIGGEQTFDPNIRFAVS